MYSVVRFTAGKPVDEDLFKDLSAVIQRAIGGDIRGLRRAGDGISCELSQSDTLDEHQARILEFLDLAASAIESAKKASIDVCVDLAVEPEDLRGKAVVAVGFLPSFLHTLALSEVKLVLSFYCP